MHVLPIASGKGGVGKSLLAVNLSIAFAQAGKKVVLIDLDLGGSNIHVMLGVTGIKMGIGNYLNNPGVAFSDVMINTTYDNLSFIPGDAEIPGMANLKSSQKKLLIKNILTLEADYVVIDLGAGSNYNIVDFFLISNQGIIITAPTLPATLDAYIFLKNVVFRIMYNVFKKDSFARAYLDGLMMEATSVQKIYVPRVLEKIKTEDPDSYQALRSKTDGFTPHLVLNLLDDPKETKKAEKLRRSSREYLDVDLQHLGVMYRDPVQDISLNSRLPILLYKPQSLLSEAIYRIADKLLQSHVEGEGPLDILSLDESYLVAEMEARIDFDTKIRHMEELLHCGVLTRSDLMDTVKNQQFELTRLKKENQVLKNRLAKGLKAGFKI